jgi:IS5 family transposase
VVQGRSDPQRELLDVESVAGHLLPAGGVFAFLAAHRGELFPDAMFADLFPSGRGRPSVPAPVVATVLVLQALHGLSDREAAEAVTFDLRWKAACGLPVTAAAFHPTTLTYWRARLAGSKRPNRVFEAVREVVSATGALAGRTRRALDSTVLDDAVATQDTVTQLVAAVRRVARTLPGGAALVAGAATCSGHDYTQPGKPVIGWDDEQARAQLIDGLVRDARAVLAAVAATEQAGNLVLEGAAGDAVGLLALVAGQDVELVADPQDPDGPGTWRIARRVAPDRVISTVDPEARHAHKTTSRRQDGFKAHVVVEPDTGIITACAVTRASGEGSGDAAAGVGLLAADTTIAAGQRVEVLGDSAYGTGEMLAALAGAGHVPVVKPWPVNPAVPGGFTVDDFSVDEHAGTVTCPAGAVRRINRVRQVNFGAACRDCPLRERCTRSRTGKSMRVGEHDALARAHRVRAADPEWRATYRQHRPMVERSLAWLTRGNRRLRYRGTTKNDAWLQVRAGAVNLRRLLALGLQRTDGAWALP